MKPETKISDIILEQTPGIGRKNQGIVDYLLERSRERDGLAICTFREIQRETGRSLSTIHTVFKQLRECGYIYVIRSGVYQVNQNGMPAYCASTDTSGTGKGNMAQQ